jgi:multidrug efflux pump subunit AcrB
VVVLENIYRHLELGEAPELAAREGGREVALPVLAATLTTVIVFFPVTFLYGVSRFLFSALALAVVISLFASYAVAMTVVPLFCARFIKHAAVHETPLAESSANGKPVSRGSFGTRFNAWFNRHFESFLRAYDSAVARALKHPAFTLVAFGVFFIASLLLFPLLGISFFPRTDAGQFQINLKAPPGTRIALTEAEVQRVEDMIRKTIEPSDLGMIVSNIGSVPDFSAIYTQNSGMHTATVQVALADGHKVGSFEYMTRVKSKLQHQFPELTTFFQSGGIVDAVLNSGMPAPIDVQIAGSNMKAAYRTAVYLQRRIGNIPNVADAYIPQDIDYPALQLNIDRTRAAELGLSQHEVVSNVITALTSNMMIAPSYWVDPKNGNNYLLTVQYPDHTIRTMADLRSIPLRGHRLPESTRLDMVSSIKRFGSPTEVDHYQIRRTIDIYVRPLGEDLGRIASHIDQLTAHTKLPEGVDVTLRGLVQAMRASFKSFALGLILAVVLLYLILVAQFKSFTDPFIILLALPPGISGVILTLLLTGTTLNIMSLMGVVLLAGIALSNSILIVEFAHLLMRGGKSIAEAVTTSCRVRMRPVLMTSLATIIGLLPMALKLGEGSESYAPLARALLGGLTLSVLFTVFLVPAGFYLLYRNRPSAHTSAEAHT